MSLRDYMFENLRWKIAALLLAVCVWFTIQIAIWKGVSDWHARILEHQPVKILTAPGDTKLYRIEPPEVTLVLRSSTRGAKNLSDQHTQVFVNLTDIPDAPAIIREVLVLSPDEVDVVRTEPKAVSVYIERIGGTQDSLTNSITKP